MSQTDTLDALLNRSREIRARALQLQTDLQKGIARGAELTARCRKLLTDFVKSKHQRPNHSGRISKTTKKSATRKRRKQGNVVQLNPLLARPSSGGLSAPVVHDQKIVSAQLLTFPRSRRNDRWPMSRRNSPSLPPLLRAPQTDSHVRSHLLDRGPASEQLIDHFHAPLITGDNLSSQGQTCGPVTAGAGTRTMCPMGKATTPGQFKRDFCKRLAAARVMRGYDQAEFAKLLGLLPNTYSKYERRSLLPHYLVAQACEILEVDVSYLFGATAVPKAKARVG
jgi:DNA-binding XRE family transcriptional regulator